ncbi:MAG TPA: ATP-dependent sacrificial sulfur transferase LarE [Terriglobales bacterium]|nr:ATP-dependent sacrificial sulfur transferase LarE [Terriglobales bacterium]
MKLAAKHELLRNSLSQHRPLLIAYSGGIDSAYLAFEAHRVLGNEMLAVIADSPSLAREHLRAAIAFAGEHRIPLEVVSTSEMQNPDYVRNDPQRCFHCKDELFSVMETYQTEKGFAAIAYGVNADDQSDFRPGQNAARKHGVIAPLLEAGLTKAEIRQLAREANLAIWDKPASACLSSRIEYGRPVTKEALAQVEAGEEALRSIGFRQFRVRHHGAICRIEIAREELPRALDIDMAAKLVRIFKGLGFDYVTLDLQGFRSGSMNSVLPISELRKA